MAPSRTRAQTRSLLSRFTQSTQMLLAGSFIMSPAMANTLAIASKHAAQLSPRAASPGMCLRVSFPVGSLWHGKQIEVQAQQRYSGTLISQNKDFLSLNYI